MGKELYRVGDLVTHPLNLNYNGGGSTDIYAKVVNIIDESGESHYEYDVITGRGDRNSKVEIVIKPLVYCKDLSHCDLDTLSVDPHRVFKRDLDLVTRDINNKMEFLQKKLDFFHKNENRIDKLNKILDVK